MKKHYILYCSEDNTYLSSISKRKTIKDRSTTDKTKAKKFFNLSVAKLIANADHVYGKKYKVVSIF